jgi:cytochrome b561
MNSLHVEPASGPERYSAATQVIHWVTALLVVAAFAYGPGGSERSAYRPSRDAQRLIHETLGMSVLILTLARIAWAHVDTRPGHHLTGPLAIVAKVVQWLLYGLLVAVPCAAIAGAWLGGHPVELLGGLRFASPLVTDPALAELIATIHTKMGNIILWIAAIHASGAAYHHLVLKDQVLASMLPPWVLSRKQ